MYLRYAAYHIHEHPVTEGDDTCNSAGPHLDPFMANATQPLTQNVTSAPASEGPAFNDLYHPTSGNLSTYQTGDLSGKYGALTTVDGMVPGREIMDHYCEYSSSSVFDSERRRMTNQHLHDSEGHRQLLVLDNRSVGRRARLPDCRVGHGVTRRFGGQTCTRTCPNPYLRRYGAQNLRGTLGV